VSRRLRPASTPAVDDGWNAAADAAREERTEAAASGCYFF
jgi:hypothetical protein